MAMMPRKGDRDYSRQAVAANMMMLAPFCLCVLARRQVALSESFTPCW